MSMRAALLALMLALLAAVASAQPQPAPSAPPAGLSEAQFEALVRAAAEAVRRELGARPAPPPQGGSLLEPAPAPASEPAFDLRRRLQEIAAGASGAVGALAKAVTRILDSSRATGSLAADLAGLCLALAAGIGLALAAGALARGWRERLVAEPSRIDLAPRVGGMALIDLAIRGVALLAAYVLAKLWFNQGRDFDVFARALATLPFWWWLLLLLPTVALRPRLASLRLFPLGDRAASRALQAIAVISALRKAVITMLPILIVNGHLPVPTAQAIALLYGLAIVGAGVGAVYWVRRGDVEERGREQASATFWLRHWPVVAIALFVMLWVAWTQGVIVVDLSLYDSLVESTGIVLSVLVIDHIVGMFEAERAKRSEKGQERGVTAPLLCALRRCLRVAAVFIVLLVVVQVWVVDRLAVLEAAQWDALRPALQRAAVFCIVGYVAWEALRYWVDRRLGPQGPSLPGEDEELERSRSRFDTLLPLLRIAGGIAIGVITVLLVLAELGVNTTPLLAGASILGLAISFGSQSLVRDIVSGVFFMLDDAFRIGDYIDSGRLKGTVEGISLRSIRLRHQNGQVHTIPFGQLQSITNFSRDWATVKFTLRLARDSDIEKVRKTVKRVGQEMLADPEFAPEFIQPLKLQGVQEIDETAIVVRCKFTVRPGKPTWVQRQALKRIHEVFAQSGIAFATPNVTVRGAASEAETIEAAAKAAVTPRARPAEAGG